MNASGQGERHIHFVDQPSAGDVVAMTFNDPTPSFAVLRDVTSTIGSDSLEVVILPEARSEARPEARPSAPPAAALDPLPHPGIASPLYVKFRGVEVVWSPRRAVLQCDPSQSESLLAAIVEFAHYERALRLIEDEIAAAWPELEGDKSLAFDITTAHLRREADLGARMGRAFGRRIRFARTEPHLYTPGPNLSATAQKLGEELRERAQLEARAEAIDAQIEVSQHIYEMASQRMGEFKAARQGHLMEWAIIWILLAEALLMLYQTVFHIRT